MRSSPISERSETSVANSSENNERTHTQRRLRRRRHWPGSHGPGAVPLPGKAWASRAGAGPYFNFYCDPKQPTVSCPQPNGHHRFEFQLMGDTTREQMEDPANIRRLLSRHVDPDKVEILRALVYTFNALVAERWRDGRVLLAGDAAHMTPQFMGQGMSSGLRDAYNLAWKLDAVIKGDAAVGLIDSYEMERSPHAQEMVAISVRNKQFVSMPNPISASQARRNASRGNSW